jgi:DNA modification methylase
MDGETAELVLTDPPYNVDYEGATKDALKIMNDKMSDNQFYQFLHDFYSAALAVTKPGGAVYVFHADSEGANFRSAMKDSGWLLKQCLIWVKSALVLGRQDYQWKHEPILYGWKPGAAHRWYGGFSETTTIDYEKPTRNGDHPTMKPVGLVAKLMVNSSKKDDPVLDCFGGSGTTLIAAEQTDRKAYLLELDPKYCDVIVRRWEEFTGKQAERQTLEVTT